MGKTSLNANKVNVPCKIKTIISYLRFSKEEEKALYKKYDHHFELIYERFTYKYIFNRVFGADANQDCVFNDFKGCVDKILDRKCVLIFAYGPSGSGKV